MTTIELVLVNVAEELVDSDIYGDGKLKELVDRVLTDCSTAESFLVDKVNNPNLNWFGSRKKRGIETCKGDERRVAERMKESVSKYMKCNDRYLQLTSLLLKSQAFHVAYATENYLPIIDLPRSERGKPYIPGKKTVQFSISHQFPFAGIARSQTKSTMLVGMDIVVFDKIDNKLYRTPEEFIKVFRSSFTASEWKAIQSAAEIVKEFYLRWAIKEAYTKALGYGASFSFSSFETKLDGVDGSLWDYVSSCEGNRCSLLGDVCSVETCKTEPWHFFFYPVKSGSGLDGYVGLCSGPVVSSKFHQAIREPMISWTSIKSLSDWHTRKV